MHGYWGEECDLISSRLSVHNEEGMKEYEEINEERKEGTLGLSP